MEKKKVIIKIYDDGQIEVVSRDKDVVVEIQAPDGSTVNAEDLKGKKFCGGMWGGLKRIERRKSIRINKHYVIRFVEKNNLAVRHEVTQIENISKGGMSFSSTTSLKPNTELWIELKALCSSEAVHFIGVVLESAHKRQGMFFRNRVKFVNLSPSAKAALEKIEECFFKGAEPNTGTHS